MGRSNGKTLLLIRALIFLFVFFSSLADLLHFSVENFAHVLWVTKRDIKLIFGASPFAARNVLKADLRAVSTSVRQFL